MLRVVKLRKFNEMLGIAIPKDMLSQMDLKAGDSMVIIMNSKTGVTVTKSEDEVKNGSKS